MYDAIGSYVGGTWVPYFRHEKDHGYIVADSTRYVMFPSFRGVVATATMITPAAAASMTAAAAVGTDGDTEEEERGICEETGEKMKKDNKTEEKDCSEDTAEKKKKQ